MKKIALPLLLFLSFLFFSCKDPEFNMQVSGRFSAEVISKILEDPFFNDETIFDYASFGMPKDEFQDIVRGLGAAKFSFDIDFATELKGLSLKKVYAKKGAASKGFVDFENSVPEKPIKVFNEYKALKSTPMELNFSGDKRHLDFCYSFLEEAAFFDSKRNGELNVSEAMKSDELKKKFKVKFSGGKVIITPAQKIDGLDMEIVISRI